MHSLKKSRFANLLRHEWSLLPIYATTAIFFLYGPSWVKIHPGHIISIIHFLWLFAVMMIASFAVAHHAGVLARALKEPLGTLILTLAVTGTQTFMIAALMIQGSNPTLARDTIFSTLMITLGALLGLALLIGGFRFREQQINFKGVNSFMELIFPLAILTLVMPNFTRTGGDGAYSPLHALCLTVLSLTIYGVFLGVQTSLHRGFFEEYEDEGGTAKKPASFQKTEAFPSASVPLLFLYLLPILLLSEHFGRILNYGMHGGGLPLEFGGLIVALLLMAPEGLAAIEAATHNKLQRSMNILFGSVLSTIGLTAPVALAIGLLLHKPVELGLSAPSMILLGTMLGNCLITFVSGRTNILQGFVHLLLFAAYIVLMFD